MTAAFTWHGRRGAVLLGPTENRVARWLLGLTREGRVTMRMTELIAATHVERSEGYRITNRLRSLGLFGIENDRGGNHHGRRFWRTASGDNAWELDPIRHREAWSRIRAWARAQSARVRARLSAIRGDHMNVPANGQTGRSEPAGNCTPAGSSTFAELMRGGGLGRLMDSWGVQ